MGEEIERKFMVVDDAWRCQVTRQVEITQGYIARATGCTVRVRIAGQTASLTVKGSPTRFTRAEYEYTIPVADASRMLDAFAPDRLIRKTRNFLTVDGKEWVVDEFHGTNRGLIMAEIELPEEKTPVSPPAWAGREVSIDHRFTNAYLVEHPYPEWNDHPINSRAMPGGGTDSCPSHSTEVARERDPPPRRGRGRGRAMPGGGTASRPSEICGCAEARPSTAPAVRE